ncbi:hypothetical protein CYMTET_38899 [Cymbomonas tetramitiformis]|uniref:Uncharacterized protein n=1 Tax=Cymbomonas tetramitiformis TaxID=36881 RepID=A0AAE0CB51_9CHLO|nr:hypothetical protein CYMTET_38899 [Cymbomonas tetramitiformis]
MGEIILEEKEDNVSSTQIKDAPGFWKGIWRQICTAAEYLEEHLADIFGLNDSKYQWAVDEHFRLKEEEEYKRKLAEAYKEGCESQQDNELSELEAQLPSKPNAT